MKTLQALAVAATTATIIAASSTLYVAHSYYTDQQDRALASQLSSCVARSNNGAPLSVLANGQEILESSIRAARVRGVSQSDLKNQLRLTLIRLNIPCNI